MGTLMEHNSANSVDLPGRTRSGDREILSLRYFRARRRLKEILAAMPGGQEEV
jgi:hypothetical protein